MTKHSVQCIGFRALQRNTLVGFAKIKIPELQLTINDVALHQRGQSEWAQLPAKPQIKDGMHVTNPETGKGAYLPVLEFDSKEALAAFGRAVWAACEDCMREAAA